MEFIQTEEKIKNPALLLIILGVLFIPVINSVDSLFVLLYRLLGLSLESLLILSVSFHGLVIVSLVWLTIAVRTKRYQPKIFLSLQTFKVLGLAFISIIIVTGIFNFYIKVNFPEAQINTGNLDMTDIAYLTLAQGGLRIFRDVILFISYFVIVFDKK